MQAVVAFTVRETGPEFPLIGMTTGMRVAVVALRKVVE
jgi:hypothetical protein